MQYKYPDLMAVVSTIAGRNPTEIEILRLEMEAIKIEKEELKRNMKIFGIEGEAPKESQ